MMKVKILTSFLYLGFNLLSQNISIGPSTNLFLGQNSSIFIHGQTNIHSTGSIQGLGTLIWFYDAVTNPDRVDLDANSALGIGGSTFYLSNQTNEVLSSLQIASGAEINIAAGSSLHVTGPVANAGTITINANSDNGGTYGQLKIDGPYPPGNSGVVTAQQYIPSNGWHLLSSPISVGFNPSNTSLDATKLYGYNGAAWMSQGQNLTTAGAGYIGMVGTGGVMSTAGTFSSQGSPNTSVIYNLNYLSNSAAGGNGSGWNLVGNPFTCNVDFTALQNTNSGIANAYYVWDPIAANGAGVYKYYAANAISGQYLNASATLSGVIPPFQGFWVQAASANQSLSFSMANHGTVVSPTPLLKQLPDNLILTVYEAADSSFQDATWLAHDPNQQTLFDAEGDAWKMDNGAGAPNIWSEFQAKRFAVNGLNLLTGTPIPLGFHSTKLGTNYKIHLEQVSSGYAYGGLLKDLLTGQVTDLNQTDHSFVQIDYHGPRFLLYPSAKSGLGTGETGGEVFAYYANGGIYVQNLSHTEPILITLYSGNGQLITSQYTTTDKPIQIELAQGLYHVVYTWDNEHRSQKITVMQ
jgi:hypothetical protein